MIDDDAEDIEFFFEVTRGVLPDCEIRSARSCEDALTVLQTSSSVPDRIFLDGMLYGMSSMECLQRIKTNNTFKDIRVVIYSGYLPEALQQQYLELGAEMFLRKPDNRAELEEALRKMFK